MRAAKFRGRDGALWRCAAADKVPAAEVKDSQPMPLISAADLHRFLIEEFPPSDPARRANEHSGARSLRIRRTIGEGEAEPAAQATLTYSKPPKNVKRAG